MTEAMKRVLPGRPPGKQREYESLPDPHSKAYGGLKAPMTAVT